MSADRHRLRSKPSQRRKPITTQAIESQPVVNHRCDRANHASDRRSAGTATGATHLIHAESARHLDALFPALIRITLTRFLGATRNSPSLPWRGRGYRATPILAVPACFHLRPPTFAVVLQRMSGRLQ